MRYRNLTLAAMVCAIVAGCGEPAPTAIEDVLQAPTDGLVEPVDPPADPSGQTVGDVIAENPTPAPGSSQAALGDGVVRARVRNESDVRADVFVRFIQGEAIVHLAFVQVLPLTVTTVTSPDPADRVELSGIDALGRALGTETLAFGLDFNESTPAEYVITVTGGEAVEPEEGATIPGEAGEVGLTLIEPASDLVLTLGSIFTARWVDGVAAPGAVVQVFLRPAGVFDVDAWIRVGPGVGAALDGLNDQLLIVLQNIAPGRYEVIARIEETGWEAGPTGEVITSVAPGLLNVVTDPGNVAPTLSILSPSGTVELQNGDTLTVIWDDVDPDDNATITFALVGTVSLSGVGVGAFPIGPPLAEDPDGEAADTAALRIEDVLPGRYALVGTIDDGAAVGTVRVEDAVQILPPLVNDPPKLELIEPANDVTVEPGGSFLVTWSDSDANDNARISLLLDPGLTQPTHDGNEIVLVASLGEDEDLAGDQITLGVPAGTAVGTYRLAGVITDGVVEVITQAPGLVHVTSAPDSGGGDPGGGDDISGPNELVMVEPSTDYLARLGDRVVIRLDTLVAEEPTDLRIYLTNEAFSGDRRIDVTPKNLTLGVDQYLTLPKAEVLPHDAWPREFELHAEAEFDGELLTAVAPGRVWVRQEVDLVRVEMINYSCTQSGPYVAHQSAFMGIEITWRGGGFGLREETYTPVRFWLSKDRAIPDDGADDATHRMMYDGDLESPGPDTHLTAIDVEQAFGIGITWDDDGQFGELGIPLESGEYYVMVVVESRSFGRIITPAHSAPIEVCYPIPAAPGVGEP